MDDSILEQFQCKFLVTGGVHDTAKVHPHYDLYKARREGYGSQEARRRKFMEEQKSRRRNFADMARKIAEGSDMSEEEDGEDMEEGGGVNEVDDAQKKKYRSKYPYRNQLMMSEWLVDVPEDFEENWLVAVVPIGKRSLVVSARKTTNVYSRAGKLVRNFPSLLPGGSRKSHSVQRDYCLLDCIFHEPSQSFYVLDVMCWAGHPVYDSDSEFRLFWKENKLKECEGAAAYSRVNPLPFTDIPYHPCTKESLSRLLSETPPFQVDGLLFIHKQCRYILGRTPLASWLKPHMVKDILGVNVSQGFLDLSPAMESTKKQVKMEVSAEKEEKQGKKKVVEMEVTKGEGGEDKSNGGKDMQDLQDTMEP